MGASDMDPMEEMQHDFHYVRHQSLTLDIRILGERWAA